MNISQLNSCLESIDQLYDMGKIDDIEWQNRTKEVTDAYKESQDREATKKLVRQTHAELERTQDITKFVYGSLR